LNGVAYSGRHRKKLINAQHMKAAPGRKTGTKDAEWIADLLQHGLLKASFIPPQPQRDLRDLTRYPSLLKQEMLGMIETLERAIGRLDHEIKLRSRDWTRLRESVSECWRHSLRKPDGSRRPFLT